VVRDSAVSFIVHNWAGFLFFLTFENVQVETTDCAWIAMHVALFLVSRLHGDVAVLTLEAGKCLTGEVESG
jgi:hypothetical protein